MTIFLTKNEKHSLRRVLSFLEARGGKILLSILLGAAGLGSSIGLAAVSAWLIARASQQPPVLLLLVASTAVRFFGIMRALMRYLQRLASHRIAIEGMDTLRQNIYIRLTKTRIDHLTALQRGDLLARTGADVDDVGNLIVKSLLPAAVTTLVGIGTVALVTTLLPSAGLILALCLLISGIVTPLFTMRATRIAELSASKARSDLSETIMTIMDSATELQISGQINVMRNHLESVEDTLTATTSRSARIAAIGATIDRLAMGIAVIGALLVGIPSTVNGTLPAVNLAVIVLTPLAAFEGTSEMAAAAAQLVRSAAAAVRIDILVGSDDSFPTHHIPDDGSEGPILQARNLAVGWPGGPIIAEGISLDLSPQSRTAIVGPSGIGKSTLLYTLAGMLEPRAGTLTLNGKNVWCGDRSDVTSHIAMTAEDAHIFNTSVFENIRVARTDITREDAKKLLTICGLKQWCDSLPNGVNTIVGAGGTTISGGERRRLLLARALAGPAPLLLLDEPGEHLDPATGDALMETLLSPSADNRGVLVVTHRLSALSQADKIIVLDRSTIESNTTSATVVESGTHSQLREHRSSYRWAVEQEQA